MKQFSKPDKNIYYFSLDCIWEIYTFFHNESSNKIIANLQKSIHVTKTSEKGLLFVSMTG